MGGEFMPQLAVLDADVLCHAGDVMLAGLVAGLTITGPGMRNTQRAAL